MLWAGGALASPERGDVYPLIGVTAGVDRLNEQADSWYGLGSPLARSSVEPLIDPAASDVEPASEPGVVTEAGTGAAMPAETAAPAASAGGAPDEAATVVTEVADEPAPDPQTLVITLSGGRPSLEQQWAADGTVWLLPGYQFDAEDGGWYSVVAIEDRYLEQVTPETGPALSDPAVLPATVPSASPEGDEVTPTPATDGVIDD